MYGAKVDHIEIRHLAPNKALKKGYQNEAILYLTDTSDWCIRAWEEGFIYGPLLEFAKTREYLKKLIKNKKVGGGQGLRLHNKPKHRTSPVKNGRWRRDI